MAAQILLELATHNHTPNGLKQPSECVVKAEGLVNGLVNYSRSPSPDDMDTTAGDPLLNGSINGGLECDIGESESDKMESECEMELSESGSGIGKWMLYVYMQVLHEYMCMYMYMYVAIIIFPPLSP